MSKEITVETNSGMPLFDVQSIDYDIQVSIICGAQVGVMLRAPARWLRLWRIVLVYNVITCLANMVNGEISVNVRLYDLAMPASRLRTNQFSSELLSWCLFKGPIT
jgi:hypothetical protein